MEIVTAVQAGKIIGVHPNTVSTYARQGRLPGQNNGKQWVFKKADVEKFTADYVPPKRGGKRPMKPRVKKKKPVKPVNFASGKAPERVVPEQKRTAVSTVINRSSCLLIEGACPPEKAFNWRDSVGYDPTK